MLRAVAQVIAVAVENALNVEAAAAHQAVLAGERDRLAVLLEVSRPSSSCPAP